MISIIVPVYNSEKWVVRCIESLINQTYRDIEIILVNDGSADKSLDICKSYAEKDKRIVVIDKENTGVSSTRNAGLDAAKGEYIQFVDSDDYIEPEMCEMFLKNIGNSDLAICGMRIWENERVLREPHLKSGIYEIRNNIDIYFDLRRINLGPCNKLYKKSMITHRFREDISLGEDTIFVLDYMKDVKSAAVLSECMYNVVLDNADSLNKKKSQDKLDILIDQRKKEEDVLLAMYGPSCDMTQIYNEYLLNTHAFFLQTAQHYSKILMDMIRKYANNDFLLEKIKKSVPKRWDLKVFRRFFSKKHTFLVWLYFKIKTVYYGGGRN